MKRVFFGLATMAMAMFATPAMGDLVIYGGTDGDLSGGNPKAIMFQAEADIADLSIYGFGSANNGGGSDGEEFTFSGSATAGDIIVVTGNTTSDSFYADCLAGFTHFTTVQAGFTASVNGDDAIELFQNGVIHDTYGDIDMIGDGEPWDYTDGFFIRTTGTSTGALFNQANYLSVFQGLNNLDEADHKDTIASTFGFTIVPEPSSAIVLAGLAGAAFIRRRRG